MGRRMETRVRATTDSARDPIEGQGVFFDGLVAGQLRGLKESLPAAASSL